MTPESIHDAAGQQHLHAAAVVLVGSEVVEVVVVAAVVEVHGTVGGSSPESASTLQLH